MTQPSAIVHARSTSMLRSALGPAIAGWLDDASVGEVMLNAVKLGVVLALATQWSIYSQLVYAFAFDGPREVAGALQRSLGAHGGAGGGGVFAGLQRAMDDLTLL